MKTQVGTPRCGVRAFSLRRDFLWSRWTAQRAVPTILVATVMLMARGLFAQADPASEPAVQAIAKVLPAVVNINTERVVKRRIHDPFEDFAEELDVFGRVFGALLEAMLHVRIACVRFGIGKVLVNEGALLE